eukprot:5120344-Pyramimonas_sp.AAC.1
MLPAHYARSKVTRPLPGEVSPPQWAPSQAGQAEVTAGPGLGTSWGLTSPDTQCAQDVISTARPLGNEAKDTIPARAQLARSKGQDLTRPRNSQTPSKHVLSCTWLTRMLQYVPPLC